MRKIIFISILYPLKPPPGKYFYALFLYSSFLLSIGFFARDRIVKKWRDLDIILAIYILYFILILPRSIGVAFASPDFDFLWAQNYLVFAFAGFLIPIGYSVYLAKSVAVTNRNLEQKLVENEQLSVDKLQAEQEKQQIIHRQKEQLEEEVAARTADLKKSLEELKAAQDQLVQQEKLASLGQLTANIEEILDDIEANLRKIHEHGTRADSIVKSMLQHSRGGSGKMEPTDVNTVLKEFVNLAFHGMRASKNPINVDIELDLEDFIDKVPMITEDFSRVILNLCNNAFDAMREKQGSGSREQGSRLFYRRNENLLLYRKWFKP